MRFPSYRVFSIRSILTFVLAVVMTALLWATFSSTTTHAADPASWNGAAIKFDGLQFTSGGTIKASDGLPIPVDSPYYIYTENFTPVGSSVMTERVRIIYFTPGTDPPTATSATHVRFDYDATTKKYSAAYDQTTISITPASQDSSASATSCAIDGIGWAVCPIMGFLSKGMDVIFNLISDFMKVQPLQTGNTQGSLYTAWSMMRTFANIALIIVFIIIIYSQLTNIQVSNYGIKRILPRLIIAAIAINLSYVICAIAVDISNVLGFSLQQLFVGLKDQILANGNTDNSAAILSWESITGFVLSGGTAALAGGVALGSALVVAGGSTGAAATAAVFILLPSLVGLLLAILVVLLILAARQALIVILVIIAPLAIVAYMLPNTEKWFKKWQETLMTMLIFFPAFSVVFGGSQLAGAVIIKNATSINMIILGMIVQVAPLVITPLLLKFSGGLLGNIARIANNPNKGIMDRTRNWSKSHADWHNARGLGQLDRHGNPILGADGKPVPLKKKQVIRKSARYLDQRKRRRTDRTANGEAAAQTAYEDNAGGTYSADYRFGKKKGTSKYDMAEQKAYFETNKERVHSEHAAHVDHARRTQGSMLFQPTVNAKTAKNIADRSEKETARFYNTIQSNENFANRFGAGALHSSGYKLETAKSKLENSETRMNEFYTTERATQGTRLSRASVQLESSKLKLEGSQSSYTAMITDLQHNPRSGISIAAQNAQASKEHLEGAQKRLKEFFDTERKVTGSTLNISTMNLERSTKSATIAEDALATYISKESSQPGGSLRTITMEADKIKQKKETAENELAAMLEGMKSGKLDANTLTTQQQAIMAEARDDAVRLAATKRSVVSAQFETQSRFADIMTGTGPLTEEMLDIAQGVGGVDARERAKADAVKVKRSLQSSELSNSLELLKEDAQRAGSNPKQYSAGIVQAVLDEQPMYDGRMITPERMKAALAQQAEEKNIPIFEKLRGSRHFSQTFGMPMLIEIDEIYRSNMKGAGAYGLQDNPNLNIDNYATEDEYWHDLRVSRISNLASASSTGLSGLKFGWVASSLAEQSELKANILATVLEAQRGDKPNATNEDKKAADAAKASLTGALETVRLGLQNDDIRGTFTDRVSFVREIEAVLARVHGLDPLPYNKPKLDMSLDSAKLDDIFNTLPDFSADGEPTDEPDTTQQP